jgi:four helix bundle protein
MYKEDSMHENDAVIGRTYGLVLRIYDTTAAFPDEEKVLTGAQLREASVNAATQINDAMTTDDPFERQETLRQAGLDCITIEILLRLAKDMNLLKDNAYAELNDLLQTIRDAIDLERRTVRSRSSNPAEA